VENITALTHQILDTPHFIHITLKKLHTPISRRARCKLLSPKMKLDMTGFAYEQTSFFV